MDSSIVSSVCPTCGTENPAGAKFCLECGRKLEAIGESSEGNLEMKVACDWTHPPDGNGFFQSMRFKYPFRPYQIKALEQFEELRVSQSKFHLVAPPGAGKTVIGIEIIKRLGYPAVIFSPTTTIQAQWKDKCLMFSEGDEPEKVVDHISLDARDIKLVNALTYQVLSTQSDEKVFLDQGAFELWRKDLFKRYPVDEKDIDDRIRKLETDNPKEYAKELASYRSKVRKNLLADSGFSVANLLHENARQLIDSLASHEVRVIVLDECHHLLDYWAVIIRELEKRIGECFVVGLTATPPYSAGREGLEKYLDLVGLVDFEVLTPAMVKNGDLAPYQDLVYFTECTDTEKDFLRDQQKIFTDMARYVAGKEDFKNFFLQLVIEHGNTLEKKLSWDEFLWDHLEVGVSAVRYLLSENVPLPKDINVLKEMREPLSDNDWLVLIESYSLDHLKMSRTSESQQVLVEIKAALRALGITLSESGLRKYSSPQEKVISLSAGKSLAAVEILRTEYRSMGDKLRGVVITDFEKSNPVTLGKLKGILDPDSGGAVRVLRVITSDPETDRIDAVMVTGKSVLLDSDIAGQFTAFAADWFTAHHLKAEFSIKETPYPKISEVVGEGKDWRSRNYIRLITAMFEEGLTRCIVGTRGLLGEGWDSLSLNTLIDLTSATTYSVVNQIRGRSIRLDPKNPDKLANNWDIVCLSPGIMDGESDYVRLVRKHDHYFGLDDEGQVVKGVSHLDAALHRIKSGKALSAFQLSIRKNDINQRSLAKACDREAAYAQWKVGEPFDSEMYSQTEVEKEKITFRTASTLHRSLKYLLASILEIILSGLLIMTPRYYGYGADFFSGLMMYLKILLVLLGIGLFVGIGFSFNLILKYVREAFINIPVDSSLRDIGIAVCNALRAQGWVSISTSASNLVVKELGDSGLYEVYLSGVPERDAEVFTNCYSQVLSPVRNQRYLVSRDESSLKGDFFSPLWHTIRSLVRLFQRNDAAYHPVPDMFGRSREMAEVFADAWKRRVGGGKLVYTRNEAGRKILLKYGLDRKLDLDVRFRTIWK